MTPVVTNKQVIPTAAWVVAATVFVLTGLAFMVLVTRSEEKGPFIIIEIIVPVLLAAYVLLTGYVYGDARRRGMRHVMWTWLSILVPNGLGIVIYFILREPLVVYCTTCGRAMRPGFAYCPGCGSARAAVCTKCQRVSEEGWSHCAFCGAKL
ncbi:MAG TPA: zinc ribbon domain-containing protein [Bryobacteraceae bacterium]|nr:zinc ribbon domain-containing protein [Bryobacteraceae bacterium]